MFERMVQIPSRKDFTKPRFEGVARLGENKPVSGMELVKLRFGSDDAGEAIANYNGMVVFPSGYSSIKPGEVWECSLDLSGFTGRCEAVGINCIESVLQESVTVVEGPKCEIDNLVQTQESECRLETYVQSLESKLEDVNEQNTALREEVRRIPALELLIEQLQDELDAEQTIADSALTTGTSGDIIALKKRIGEMQDIIDARDLEIEMLKDKLRNAGLDDDSKPVPKIRGQITTCLTGPSRIYCRLLTDGRYSVRFNPLEGQLCFIPNEIGTVECRNQEVYIPGLAAYSGFQFVRDLSAVDDHGDVTIQL